MFDDTPSRQRDRRQRILAVALLVLAVVVAASVGILRWRAEATAVRLGSEGCPADRPPSAFELVLVDASEGFNDAQRLFLEKFYADLDASIPDHAKVAVYVLDGRSGADLPAPIFVRCKPPSGKEASAWTQNPARLERAWRSSFREPLERALESSLSRPSSAESPIMAVLQKAVLAELPANATETPRRIVLISDLLEHTKAYSQYGSSPPDFAAFRRQPFAQHLRVDLTGVDVDVLYVSRPGHEKVQGARHLEFWKEYFVWLGAGALRLRITPVPG